MAPLSSYLRPPKRNMNAIGPEVDVESPTDLRRSVAFRANHQWPESEAKFVREIIRSKSVNRSPNQEAETRLQGFNMRQKFLRSYNFSRDDEISRKEERNFITKSMKLLGSIKESSIRGIENCHKAVSSRVSRVLFPCVVTKG